MYECHLEFSVELKKEYVYNERSVVRRYLQSYLWIRCLSLHNKCELSDGWEFENGSTSSTSSVIIYYNKCMIRINLWSVLFNKKSASKIENLEAVTDYEERSNGSKNDDGNSSLASGIVK